MFDSPQYPKNSQLCLTQSPKYYHQNQNQIFVGSYDYEPFNFQGDHMDHENQVLNLNLNFNWSAFSQRTPKSDRITQSNNIQISYYDSTFTDRSMCQGNISIISEKRRRTKNKNQDFSEFISINRNTLNTNNIFKEFSIVKVKQQLKNLTKNMLKQSDKVRQPLQQHNNDNNMNNKKQKTDIQQKSSKFRHINRKNMPTRKNIPKFRKSQTAKENSFIYPATTSQSQTQKRQQIQINLQLTNIQLNNVRKIDQKLHDTYLQIYRFNRRKEEELIKKQRQKQQALNKYKQLQQKKIKLKQNLEKKKQILIEKQHKIHVDSNLYIQKLRKQKKGQFTNDWNHYFMS